MQRLEAQLEQFVPQHPEALVFTSPMGGPLVRSRFTRRVWRPATRAAGLAGVTFHGLRHSFVAILVDAGCNVREVSEWAGHNSVAATLTRYGGLFEDGSETAVDRLDVLLGGSRSRDRVLHESVARAPVGRRLPARFEVVLICGASHIRGVLGVGVEAEPLLLAREVKIPGCPAVGTDRVLT